MTDKILGFRRRGKGWDDKREKEKRMQNAEITVTKRSTYIHTYIRTSVCTCVCHVCMYVCKM